jgi:Activator of Hsp90 ATPase homolog 1-like protein
MPTRTQRSKPSPARIGRWWPVAEHSLRGAGSTVEFADGQIVERAAGGETAIWGSVTTWDPPSSLAFTWHPGRSPDRASRVRVTFTELGEQTRVRLEHSGWEVFDDPAGARAEYDEGWPEVLDCYDDDVATMAAGRRAG